MGDAKVPEVATSDLPQMPPEEAPPTIEEIATPEVLEAIVKGYNPEYELGDFSAELGTNAGDNYMSIMYALKMQIKHRTNGSTENLDIMLKTMPRNAFRQQMINDCSAFIKDAKMYNEVFPAMVAFQKSKGLKDNEIFQGWPSCYATFHDGKTDYLAMENLRVLGYRMASRHAGLDKEHTCLVLKNIARFHAVSFAMFGGDFDKIMDKYDFLEEKMFQSPDKLQEPQKIYMKTMLANVSDTVRKAGLSEAGDLVDRVYDDQFWIRLHKLIGTKVKNAVISHGDFWTNNMLFNFDEASGKPNAVKFVDFQLSRCASRCIDLNYFFYSSLPLPLLNENEEELLKVYFEEFNSFVSKLGVDPEEHELTWENIKEEYDSCRFYGVVMGLMLAPILCADSQNVPDMESLKMEDFGDEAAKEFLGGMMGDLATVKITNIAVKHLPKCREMSN